MFKTWNVEPPTSNNERRTFISTGMPSIASHSLTVNRRIVLTSETVWLCLIVAVGATVRLYGLDSQSLWQDEGLQYYVATQNSLSELFYQRRSFHPPLSFMINHIFLLLGDSDFLLRLPSALFGIASLPVLYVLASDLTSSRAAVFSVLVLAVSPFNIWYSQEGRMYSQLLFLSLLSAMLLTQALRYGKARWWLCYMVVGAAGMYTHVFMALALFAQLLWMSLFERRHLASVIVSVLAIAVLFVPWALLLPWVSNFARGVSRAGLVIASSTDGRAGFTLAAVPYTFFVYAAGFSLGPTVAELHSDRSLALLVKFLPSISVVMTVFAVLLCTGIFVAFKHFSRRNFVFCLFGLFVPLAGVVAYSLTPHATFNVRYTVIAYPYFCLFVGTALAHVISVRKILGAAAVIAVIGISSVSLQNYFGNPRYTKEDVRSAVAFWRQTAKNEPLLAIGSMYPAHRYVGESREQRLFLVGSTTTNIRSRIEKVLSAQDISSAYVVLARDWDGAGETAIRSAFGGTLERSFPGVQVFRISSPRTFQTSDPSAASAPSHQP